MRIVIIGGLIDSVLGIVNCAVVAITSAASAVVLPLLPPSHHDPTLTTPANPAGVVAVRTRTSP